MKKSAIILMPQFFDRYINLVEDMSISDAFSQYNSMEFLIPLDTLIKLDTLRYAPDKWTVKEILQHIIDNERIQACRALRIARNDDTPLPGYDENLFAQHSEAEHRNLEELLAEFKNLRKSSLDLYAQFTDEMLMREGMCFNQSISVLALGFVNVGHAIHHANVIHERYVPLL